MSNKMKCRFEDLAVGQWFRKVPTSTSIDPSVWIKKKDEDITSPIGWGEYQLLSCGNNYKYECYGDMMVYPCDPNGTPLPEEMGLWERIQYYNKYGFYPPTSNNFLKNLSPIKIAPDPPTPKFFVNQNILLRMSDDMILIMVKNCTIVTNSTGAKYIESIIEKHEKN